MSGTGNNFHNLPHEKKAGRYDRVYNQLQPLLQKTKDPIARMATIVSVLTHKFPDFFWCGYYRLVGEELIVGPYQGPLACQVLEKNKGVCWAGVNKKKSIVVPDVHAFPGHIACDSRSNSEIVIPCIDAKGNVFAILDIDSKDFNTFDNTDEYWLTKINSLI
ncbi:MAG: GAF domain-containing protein [Bacteroidota bacterium]